MKERWLFWGLVALLLIPVWSVDYFPTTDGPSHVYNSRRPSAPSARTGAGSRG